MSICNVPFISVYSDASDVACGGHVFGKNICAHRMLALEDRAQSSTYRELLAAIQFVLESLSSFLSTTETGRLFFGRRA